MTFQFMNVWMSFYRYSSSHEMTNAKFGSIRSHLHKVKYAKCSELKKEVKCKGIDI